MNNKVCIFSRMDAEHLIENGFPKNTAVISFYDPPSSYPKFDYKPVDYKDKCERYLGVCVRDIDIEILSDYGLTFETYLPEVDEIAKYILMAQKDGLDILCQCEYGQSRSAACAAAIKEFFDGNGIEIFADYRYYPNQLIFNKILKALKECGAIKHE